MPTASIQFTDDTGAATLHNGKPAPGDRFDGWQSVPVVNGSLVHRQSDMTPTRLRTSTVRGAAFSLSKIPIRTTDGDRLYTIAERLCEHLQNGGSVTVNTGDTDDTVHSGLYLAPGAVPTLSPPDENMLEAVFSVVLFKPDGTRLVCYYDA